MYIPEFVCGIIVGAIGLAVTCALFVVVYNRIMRAKSRKLR